MRPAVFEPIADGMLLVHAERVAVPSTMLQALAEKDPERWGVIVDKMQESIVNAYQTGSVKLLKETLAVIERTYCDIARSHGMDPATGKRMGYRADQ